jgi:hypothetical protein
MLKINPTFGKPKRLLYIHNGNVVKQTRFGYVLGILAAWVAGVQVVVEPEHCEKLWMRYVLYRHLKHAFFLNIRCHENVFKQQIERTFFNYVSKTKINR